MARWSCPFHHSFKCKYDISREKRNILGTLIFQERGRVAEVYCSYLIVLSEEPTTRGTLYKFLYKGVLFQASGISKGTDFAS